MTSSLDIAPVAILRENTKSAHEQLERSDFIMPSTEQLPRYSMLIGAMLSFHRAIEREFRRFEHELNGRGFEMNGRYKTTLLEAESNALESPAVDEPLLHFATAAHAAGGVYVMEGSTLGGTLIARSVNRHLGLQSRYYGCYGSETAQRWRATSQLLDAFPSTSRDISAMVHGANLTFATLRRHLQSTL